MMAPSKPTGHPGDSEKWLMSSRHQRLHITGPRDSGAPVSVSVQLEPIDVAGPKLQHG
jgi:hypothetical protein